MKGKLIKTENEWQVEYLEFFRTVKSNGIPVDTEYLVKTIHLDEDDAERLSFRSDKKPDEIIGEEVEFEIIENQKLNGVSLSAKLIYE